jgi:hypothetical protein
MLRCAQHESAFAFRMKEKRSMTSIPQQAETLQQVLEEEAVQLAKETGFIERGAAMGM